MKKIILAILIAFFVSSSAVHAGLWSKMSHSGKTIQPEYTYKIEAAGWNLRAYEWTCPGNPKRVCGFVAGSKKGGPYSYPKPEVN